MDYRSDDFGNWREHYVVSCLCGAETTFDQSFCKIALKPLDRGPKPIVYRTIFRVFLTAPELCTLDSVTNTWKVKPLSLDAKPLDHRRGVRPFVRILLLQFTFGYMAHSDSNLFSAVVPAVLKP